MPLSTTISRDDHDARVYELLAVNNREVERRRVAEAMTADLYEALIQASHELRTHDPQWPYMKAIRGALAKWREASAKSDARQIPCPECAGARPADEGAGS